MKLKHCGQDQRSTQHQNTLPSVASRLILNSEGLLRHAQDINAGRMTQLLKADEFCESRSKTLYFAAGSGWLCSFSRRSSISLGSPCNSSRNAALVQPKPTTFIS